MGDIFLKLLNMSIAAGWLILAVIAFRFFFRKAPKWMRCLLWGMVALRLICPFSFESVFSLVPSPETLSPHTVRYAAHPAITSGITAIDSALNPIIGSTFAAEATASANPLYIWTEIAGMVWLSGLILILGYGLISCIRLRHNVREAAFLRENIWLCDAVRSPFVFGLFRPRIYLSSDMDEAHLPYVLAHEQAHLRRKDHWWKLSGYIFLAVYWFHPLIWTAYILFCRDMELACDEKVIHAFAMEKRKAYAHALLSCSTQRRVIFACPLAFGEGGVKGRVSSVLNYQKTTLPVMAAAAAACIAVTCCFLTDPVSGSSEALFAPDTDAPVADGSDSSDEAHLLREYAAFGISQTADRWYYNDEPIRYFLDGYEQDDGHGAFNTIARYQYYDDDGTVDVHTVRNDTVNSDGSVTLFGPIADIVPYSRDEFDARSFAVNDSISATAAETDRQTVEADTAETDVLSEQAEATETGVLSEQAEATGTGVLSEQAESGATIADLLEKYSGYGITYKAISGSQGNIYYKGALVNALYDQKPDGSVFSTHSFEKGDKTAYTVYDETGKLTGISVR